MAPKQKPGRSKQDYRTPPEFLAAVKRKFCIEKFDWDLAADARNSVAGACFFDAGHDALASDSAWPAHGGWNWLNPPYAHIAPWVRRAWFTWGERGGRTLVLVPAGVGSNWWRDWVHRKAHVYLLNGRLSFDGKAPYPKDCVLLAYGLPLGYDVWTWTNSIPKETT
jgi:phage N-6-adenine-methyltransferase